MFSTTNSDDSNFDSVSQRAEENGTNAETAALDDANRAGDNFDSEGSTHTSAPQVVDSDGSTRERFGEFDVDESTGSGSSIEIIETDASWKEPADVQIKLTSEESAEFDSKSTVISSGTKTAKAGDAKNVADDGEVLKPGERFGQFTVVRFVGGGGMGRVYEGVDNELERKVAIKVLPKRRAQDEGVVARFLNEAKSAARLNHENIAQVYLSGNVDGIPYIAFEYVDGTNLRDYVRERGVLELNEAIDFVLQAADALAHAASHGVTHRDVKPSNIIITPQKRAKLIDMGLARLLKDDADDDLTESGVTLGTFDYISPEQARDPRLADVRSDVYSLGCTFYYMLVGAPPFPEGTMLQKLLQHQGDEAPDVREANPKTPVEIASVIKKMMRKNPDERYQKPEALIADLKEISELLGIRVSNADASGNTKNNKASSLRWKRFIPVLLSACVLLAFVVVFRLTSDSKMELPDVAWNETGAPQAQQDKSGLESGEKKPKDDAQNGQNAGLATNASVAENAASEKKNANETSSGKGKVGDALDLDRLYAFASNASLENKDVSTPENAFSLESDSSAQTRRLAFCWNARAEEEGATITLCAGLAEASESNDVRSCALRVPDARDVKKTTSEPQTNENLFIVDGKGAASNSFATLREALDASASRDSNVASRIELRFNGSINVAPMTLVGRKIEIIAGEGFQPALIFQPAESTSDVRNDRFLRLTSSDALIDGVFISFVVPKERTGSKFAIFETSDASNLTIRNSSLTFNAATNDSTVSSSFFALTKGEKVESGQNSADVQTKKNVVAAVRLENVFVRGDATLANIARTGARIEAENCLFNLSGAFFRYVASEYDVPDESSFSVNCNHILATCGSFFVQINAENSENFLPSFDVSVSNSLIRMQTRPFTFVSSAIPLPEETFWSEWNFKGTSLLDATTFCRCNFIRGDLIKDYPSPFERNVCETVGLSADAREANKRWESVAPSLLTPSEFVPLVLAPLDDSTDVLSTTKENAKTLRELAETLAARFPEYLTK